MRVACIGECMIELRENQEGGLTRRFGGDTLNTALYLARLSVTVDFVTALGCDDWSSEMITEWCRESIGTSLVVRCPDELPGLYVIQTGRDGERRFSYWRSNSAARKLFSIPETDHLVEALQTYPVLYYSGITLSIFDDNGRARLLSCLQDARRKGAKVAFDTNFRTRGWPDRDVARAAFLSAIRDADLVFASSEDVELLFGDGGTTILVEAARSAEVVLKTSEPGCSILCSGCSPVFVPALNVVKAVDTTAAGDSFAAAYLAARLSGRSPQDAALEGHRLASTVVLYPGAIIPLEAMPGRNSSGPAATVTPLSVVGAGLSVSRDDVNILGRRLQAGAGAHLAHHAAVDLCRTVVKSETQEWGSSAGFRVLKCETGCALIENEPAVLRST